MRGSFILRIGLGIVFVYFSIMQFRDPTLWIRYLPLALQGKNALLLVYLNAGLDAILAFTITLSFLPRLMPLIATVHLVSIAAITGINDVSVRDFGLAMACLSLVLIHEEHIPWRQRKVMQHLFGKH